MPKRMVQTSSLPGRGRGFFFIILSSCLGHFGLHSSPSGQQAWEKTDWKSTQAFIEPKLFNPFFNGLLSKFGSWSGVSGLRHLRMGQPLWEGFGGYKFTRVERSMTVREGSCREPPWTGAVYGSLSTIKAVGCGVRVTLALINGNECWLILAPDWFPAVSQHHLITHFLFHKAFVSHPYNILMG